MLKKIGLPVAALFGAFLLAGPPPAKAEVHVGVYFGAPAPVYQYAQPAYGYGNYYTAPAYGYQERRWRDNERWDRREDWRRDRRDHDNYRDNYRRGDDRRDRR